MTVADTGNALSEARAAAFEDAHTRAAQLAELSGAELGEALIVEDHGASDFDGGPEGFVATAKAGGDMAFEAGERAMAVSVRVTWSLR